MIRTDLVIFIIFAVVFVFFITCACINKKRKSNVNNLQ